MNTFFNTLLTLAVFAIMATPEAEGTNPDGKGYIESRFIMGAGVGDIADSRKLEPLPYGFGLRVLSPISERVTIIMDGSYVWRRTQWPRLERMDTVNRFQFEIGLRFHLK